MNLFLYSYKDGREIALGNGYGPLGFYVADADGGDVVVAGELRHELDDRVLHRGRTPARSLTAVAGDDPSVRGDHPAEHLRPADVDPTGQSGRHRSSSVSSSRSMRPTTKGLSPW